MFKLRTLGVLSLESDTAPLPTAATQRRRLAFLVLLARAGDQGITRDKIIGYLWPESTDERARHALEQLLYATRRDLGSGCILSVSGSLRLDSRTVTADVVSFESALARGDLEQAVSIYAGPFLDGVYLSGAPEFERWVEGERAQLQERYAEILETLAMSAEIGGDYGAALGWRRRLAARDPMSSRYATGLIRALAGGGDTAAALRQARIYQELVRRELEIEPDPAIEALVETLRHRPVPPPQPDTHRQPLPRPRQVEAVDSPPAASVAEPSEPQPSLMVPPSVRRPHRRIRQRVLASAAAALAGLILLGVGARAALESEQIGVPALAPNSVGVLPFVDMSPEQDAEYLADGITEELIHLLSGIGGLRVPARTSSFAFKGENQDVRAAGAALGVRTVLEGSVRRTGDRLRVIAQLVDVESGYQLWSETYDRRADDVFAVQDEIARAIAERFQLSYRGVSGGPATTSHTNPQAYNAYLLGRYFWHQRSQDALERAAASFQDAIRLDPGHAPAYAGLADTYNSLAEHDYAPLPETWIRAKRTAEQALTLDPRSVEAYTALGHVQMHLYEWDASDQNLRRAIRLNPGYALAHHYQGMSLVLRGRFADGIMALRQAQQLDPLSGATNATIAFALYLSRSYPEAVEQARWTLEMEPERAFARVVLGSALLELGQVEEAVAELEMVVDQSGGHHPKGLPALGYAYARANREREARAVLARIENPANPRTSPVYIAALYAALGNQAQAFELLERAVGEHNGWATDLGVDPMLDPLRSDPRFLSLLTTTGLK